MELPHKLDFDRIRQLERISNEKVAVGQRQHSRVQEAHKALLNKRGQLSKAEENLAHSRSQGRTFHFSLGSNATHEAPVESSVRETWERNVERLKRDVASCEADLKDAQVDAEIAGEDASAAAGLLAACRKFKVELEAAEREEHE